MIRLEGICFFSSRVSIILSSNNPRHRVRQLIASKAHFLISILDHYRKFLEEYVVMVGREFLSFGEMRVLTADFQKKIIAYSLVQMKKYSSRSPDKEQKHKRIIMHKFSSLFSSHTSVIISLVKTVLTRCL